MAEDKLYTAELVKAKLMGYLSFKEAREYFNDLRIKKRSQTYSVFKILIKEKSVRPCRQHGKGKDSHYQDCTRSLQFALAELNINYEFKNTSPRNGKPGNLIILTEEGIQQTSLLRYELNKEYDERHK